MSIFLETKRLIINTPGPADFDNLFALQSDADVALRLILIWRNFSFYENLRIKALEDMSLKNVLKNFLASGK